MHFVSQFYCNWTQIIAICFQYYVNFFLHQFQVLQVFKRISLKNKTRKKYTFCLDALNLTVIPFCYFCVNKFKICTMQTVQLTLCELTIFACWQKCNLLVLLFFSFIEKFIVGKMHKIAINFKFFGCNRFICFILGLVYHWL